MKKDFFKLKIEIERLNLTKNIQELVDTFLNYFENDNNFKLILKKKVLRFSLNTDFVKNQFNSKVEFPFDIDIRLNHLTFYFRHNQESLTKNINSPHFKKPDEFSKKDYIQKIFDKKEIPIIINTVFNEELKLNLITTENFINPKKLFADELNPEVNYLEGKTKKVLVNIYERNSAAREKCIEHFGTRCQICEFNFQEKFGDLGKDFIHVHHKIDISTIGNEYSVNPLTDLIPVCPNCHSMLHKRVPAFSIEELKEIIRQ